LYEHYNEKAKNKMGEKKREPGEYLGGVQNQQSWIGRHSNTGLLYPDGSFVDVLR
jgi:hypothetical protein